jgi:UDP-galactopyranose mutase
VNGPTSFPTGHLRPDSPPTDAFDYMIVGAGFAGAVLAERLATQLNQRVLMVERRHHIGGNAFDRHDEHGILVHPYGAAHLSHQLG